MLSSERLCTATFCYIKPINEYNMSWQGVHGHHRPQEQLWCASSLWGTDPQSAKMFCSCWLGSGDWNIISTLVKPLIKFLCAVQKHLHLVMILLLWGGKCLNVCLRYVHLILLNIILYISEGNTTFYSTTFVWEL